MEAKGVFIVIEGSDGSGKTTQLGLVKQRLETMGYAVEMFDFPQYEQPSSYFVKQYLKGEYGKADDVGPYTSSLFYALDRFEAGPRIRDALAAGKIVISDRFTGSNMAHQGTKIANAEQRRGFFIWLDNLEFEMLRIPRPTLSFILRVPADISQQLLTSRPERDIHETDLTHLARTVSVYDDMSQLFPKDFQRIDCVRSGQLLDVQTVNTMLWEKISPLLPPPPATQPQPAEAATPALTIPTKEEEAPTPAAETPNSLAQNHYAVLTNASGLLIQRIERLVPEAEMTDAEIPTVFVPQNLVPDAQKAYESKTQELLRLYAKLHVGLTKQGVDAAEARRLAALVLPTGTAATVHVPIDAENLPTLVLTLMNDPLPEMQAAGADLFAQAIKINPQRFTDTMQPAKQQGFSALETIADEFLAQNHIGDQPPVQLVSVWPRNENDLIPDMLYSHTSLPLRTIQDRIASWPMSRKLQVFEAYVSDSQPGPVLGKATYSWDLLNSYATFRTLQKLPVDALELQRLTPRYGFDMPKAIDAAGLGDTYEACFDLALGLYSDLQQAGHQLEAQYATLYGHNQRWKMTQNAVQFHHMLHSINTSEEVKKFLHDMHARLSETHPAIGEAIGGR